MTDSEGVEEESYCYHNLLEANGSLQTYIVSDDVRVGDAKKDITYTGVSMKVHANSDVCVAYSNSEDLWVGMHLPFSLRRKSELSRRSIF